MTPAAARLAFVVRGLVQGVGFRPFVHALAQRLDLGGFVRNRADGVLIEVEGERSRVAVFEELLRAESPPLARVEGIDIAELRPRGRLPFAIVESDASGEQGHRFLTPDVATCRECLDELLDPADRRYRYPFISCTQCGPRFTVLCGAPYDRGRTTMASFLLCAPCRAEYEDPGSRRFHAQTIACSECGPRLSARDADGRRLDAEPLSFFGDCVRSDRIVAVKGLGGYHLACDATSDAAVERLRRRKDREEKPFAVLVPDLDSARRLCRVSEIEAELLSDARGLIVLLQRLSSGRVAAAVAEESPLLGLMLPYTPLHHLLSAEVGGRPLVLTSGNRSDEPIAYDDEDALQRLRGIADGFLVHDRAIQHRCDDSVARVLGGKPSVLRRSRGYAPGPVRLPFESPARLLALGGHSKNTFALGRGRHAFLSHHLGDLDDYAAYRAFREAVRHYESLLSLEPQVCVHDLHPGYATTEYAQERQLHAGSSLRLFAVQHHHAHMASCMAENGLTAPVIGVTFDGAGYGGDGSLWGGEFLVGDYRAFRRAAHFRAVPLPGGEQAVREPWRMALAYLVECDEDPDRFFPDIRPEAVRVVRRMMEAGFNSPRTTSVGRLFDAVAALLRVRSRSSFEGQAPSELEALALASDADEGFAVETERYGAAIVVDTRSIVRDVLDAIESGAPRAQIARRFHNTIASAVARVVARLRDETGIADVALSGGVFQNALLLDGTRAKLEANGLSVHVHSLVPCNDGGLSLGQLAVAAAQLQSEA